MEKSTLPELSLEAQHRFREAVKTCLAGAQERLVEEVQQLAAHLSTTVADQVVQLHEDATREVKLDDTNCTSYGGSSATSPEALAYTELPSTPHQSGTKPRVLPPLLSPSSSQTGVQADGLKSCLSKGPKRCKIAPTCDFAVRREEEFSLIESRADKDSPKHIRASAVVLIAPQETRPEAPEDLRKVADTDDSYALLNNTDADAAESRSKANACREDSDEREQPQEDGPAVDASNKGSADDESHPPRPSVEFCDETQSCGSPSPADDESHPRRSSVEFCDETRSCGSRSLRHSSNTRQGSKGSCNTTATSVTATKVVLQPTWVEAKATVSRKLRMLQSRGSERGELGLRRQPSIISFQPVHSMCSDELFPSRPSLMQRLILRPGHPICIVWDILTAFAIIHDVIIIPLLAFDLEENTLLDVMEVLTSIVWAGDLFLSFFRGVADNEEGIIEMRPKKIARLYLKSWFLLDFGVVFLDFLQLCMSGTSKLAGVILLVRMFRILRLARIVKILKVSERLTIVRGRFSEILAASSEKKAAVLSILKLLMIMVVVNHFAACGWYGIGSLGTEGRHWVIQNLDERDASFTYRYGTSFHWAVTQFTPASMEVYPTNSIERVYNICVIFGGLLMFSGVISAMTQIQLYIQQISDTEKKQRKAVQRYITANSVSIELSSSILLFLRRHKEGHKRHLIEQDVSAFGTLPEHMVIRLRFEVFSPTLLGHAILSLLMESDMHSMNMICHNAASELCVLRSEDVFQVCVKATHMYFVTSGRLAYFLGFEACADEIVERGKWISEPILWIEWEHSGRLSGESRCNTLAQLNAIQFLRFAAQSCYVRKLRSHARLYAREAQLDFDSLSDLWGTPERTRSMVGKDENLRRSALSAKNGKMWMLFAPALPLAFMGWKAYVQERKKASRQHWCCSWPCRRRRYISEESVSDCDASSSWPPSVHSSNCFTPHSEAKLMFHADPATVEETSLIGAVDNDPMALSMPSGHDTAAAPGLLGG